MTDLHSLKIGDKAVVHLKLAQVFEKFTFTDGTPFGMKVEE